MQVAAVRHKIFQRIFIENPIFIQLVKSDLDGSVFVLFTAGTAGMGDILAELFLPVALSHQWYYEMLRVLFHDSSISCYFTSRSSFYDPF